MQKNFVMRTMKKMAAIGTGVAMVGATITGAMALDLADYPSPFVVDGVYDDSTALVVGDDADAADTLGAVDIASDLQFQSKVAVESDAGSVSVVGGKSVKVPLGFGLTNKSQSLFDATLQDDDVANLFDGEINFQGTSYDTSEEIELNQWNDPIVATSLSSSDDDYKSDVHLEVNTRDVVRFFYKFDESVNISKATSADPLNIDFLGDKMKITSIDSAGNKFTAYVGDEHYIKTDESVDVDVDGVSKKVTLLEVSSTSALIDVDGVTKIIADGSTSTVNGVEVTVDDVFSRTERAESSANLIIGKQSSETYTDGDAYVGEDKDDPNWVWNLANLATQGTTENLSIENDFVFNDIDSGAKAVGECVSLPNDYVKICFNSLSVSEDDYSTYTFKLDTSADFSDTLSTNTSVPALSIRTDASEGLELTAYAISPTVAPNETSTKRTKEVWIYTGGAPAANTNAYVNGSNYTGGSGSQTETKWLGVFYKDTSASKVKMFGQLASNSSTNGVAVLRLNYGNTKDTNLVLQLDHGVAAADTAARINFTIDVTSDDSGFPGEQDDLMMDWGLAAANGSFDSLGDTRSTEEATELLYGHSAAPTNIGTKDEDHRTMYGIVIKNPKTNGASDTVELSVPSDQVKANVVIEGTSTTVSSAGTSWVPAEVTPVTKLASEVGDASDYQLIVVGGPCANDLAAELFEVSCDGWSFEEGEAVLKLVENGDKVALLVAGTAALDTRRAAKALANWESYELSGSEVKVSGTTLEDINVESAEAAA